MTTNAPSDSPDAPPPAAGTRAAALRAARVSLSMTQDILAGAANLSTRTIMRAETGKGISDENLRSVCAVLGLDASRLPPVQASASAPIETETPDAPAEKPAAEPRRRRRPGSTACIVAALLAATAVMNVATNEIFQRFHRYQAPDAYPILLGSFLASMTNRVATAMQAGKAPSTSDIELKSFQRIILDCTDATVLGSINLDPLPRGCVQGDMDLEVKKVSGMETQYTLSPVSRSAFENFVVHLTQSRMVSVKVSFTGSYAAPRADAFWYDPRFTNPQELPPIPAGKPFMHVNVSMVGER